MAIDIQDARPHIKTQSSLQNESNNSPDHHPESTPEQKQLNTLSSDTTILCDQLKRIQAAIQSLADQPEVDRQRVQDARDKLAMGLISLLSQDISKAESSAQNIAEKIIDFETILES